MDAETGSATVLVNPTAVTEAIKPLLKDYIGEMVQGVRSGGVGADAVGMERVEEEREVDLGPKGKPAWKVVTGGDLDHLQLNRRGLYTAGKVQYIQYVHINTVSLYVCVYVCISVYVSL